MWHYPMCLVFLPWTVFVTPSDLYTPIFHSYEVQLFSALNSTHHFIHIYCLDFQLKKISCLQTLRRFYGVTSFSRYPLLEFIFLKIKLFFASCETWALNLDYKPSCSYTLAYCRPIHLFSIEFQNIDSNSCTPPKSFCLLQLY
jgi:hypothetical protein